MLRVYLGLGVLLLALGSSAGAINAQDEILASIRPSEPGTPNSVRVFPGGRFEGTGLFVRQLILLGLNVQSMQLADTPDWMLTERYNVSARIPGVDTDIVGAEAAMRRTLRELMITRFGLVVVKEMRDTPVFFLILDRPDGRLGAGLRPSMRQCELSKDRAPADPNERPCGIFSGPSLGNLYGDAVEMVNMAKLLSSLSGRIVVDRTDLKGHYDVDLKYTSDRMPPQAQDDTKPDLFTAIREQLGLQLKAGTTPVEMTVVEHINRHPTDN